MFHNNQSDIIVSIIKCLSGAVAFFDGFVILKNIYIWRNRVSYDLTINFIDKDNPISIAFDNLLTHSILEAAKNGVKYRRDRSTDLMANELSKFNAEVIHFVNVHGGQKIVLRFTCENDILLFMLGWG